MPADELPADVLHLTGEALEGKGVVPSSHQSEVPETPTPPSASAAGVQQQSLEPAVMSILPQPPGDVAELHEKAPADNAAQHVPHSIEEQEGRLNSRFQLEDKGQQWSGNTTHARLEGARSLAGKSAKDGAARAAGTDEVFGSITMHQQRLGSINFTARTATGGKIVPKPAADMSDRALPSTLPSTSPLKVLKAAGTRQRASPLDKLRRVARTLHKEEAASKQAEGVQLPILPVQPNHTDGPGPDMLLPGNEIVLAPGAQLPNEEKMQDALPFGSAPSMPSGFLADRVEDSEAEDEATMIQASQPAIFTQ